MSSGKVFKVLESCPDGTVKVEMSIGDIQRWYEVRGVRITAEQVTDCMLTGTPLPKVGDKA